MPYLANYAHDIFVSYAHGPTSGSPLGIWSRKFVEYVRQELLISLQIEKGKAREPAIWVDESLPGNAALNNALKTKVEQSALLLVLMSDHYLKSDYCKAELEWFVQACRKRGHGVDGRIFVVRTMPTATPWPTVLVDCPTGYWFHAKDELRPFGWPNLQVNLDGMPGATEKLVTEICAQLKKIEGEPAKTQPRGHSVFLGFAHDSLDDERADLRRALVEAGLTVLPPEIDEIVDEHSLNAALDRYLPKASSMVLMANEFRGVWPREQPAGFISLQRQRAKAAGKRCDLWLLSDVAKARRPEYRQYLEEISKEATSAGEKIQHQSMDEFASYVARSFDSAPAPTLGPPAVIYRNQPEDPEIGDSILESVMDTVGEMGQIISLYGKDDLERIEVSKLGDEVRDARTVLILCYDQEWAWVKRLLALLHGTGDLRAPNKVRLLVAAPRNRQAPTLDARAVGFRTVNGVDNDAARMREQLRKEIEVEQLRIAAKHAPESRM